MAAVALVLALAAAVFAAVVAELQLPMAVFACVCMLLMAAVVRLSELDAAELAVAAALVAAVAELVTSV